MRWLVVVVPALVLSVVVPALGEKPTIAVRPALTPGANFSMGELTPTPEMWFYEQYLRQYQDPKVAVRAAAEFRADQRQKRIAAMKWYGFSNQRPKAGVDPIHSDFSPAWSSGSANYPFRWSSASTRVVVVTP